MTSHQAYAAAAQTLYPGASLAAHLPLAGGVSATVHRLELRLLDGSQRQLVLREHAANTTGLPASVEFALLRALHRYGLPVPEVFAVDDSCAVLPHPYLLMAMVAGASGVASAQAARSRVVMCDMLQRIHALPVTELPGLPLRVDPLAEVFDFLPTDARWNSLRERLTDEPAATYEGARVLLHGDFWPENLLWRDGELVAVLDWEDAALGDPLSDVACTGLELRYRYGFDGMAQFIETYSRSQVVDRRRLALWQVYGAAAAQRFMADWGLPQEQEQHMRREALATLAEAEAALAQGSRSPTARSE